MAGEIKRCSKPGGTWPTRQISGGHCEQFKKALEKDPDEPTVLANLADAHLKSGRTRNRWQLRKGPGGSPEDAALWTNKGVVLGKMGKTAESKEAFKKAASLDPAAAAQNFYNLGATMVNNGQAKEAAEAFRQAITSDPNYAEAYYQLGLSLSGDPPTMAEAVQMLQKYIQIGKDATNVEVAKQLITALKK